MRYLLLAVCFLGCGENEETNHDIDAGHSVFVSVWPTPVPSDEVCNHCLTLEGLDMLGYRLYDLPIEHAIRACQFDNNCLNG